jgi:hypothetical protein
MRVLHFRIELSPNYFKLKQSDFHKSSCVGIILYKTILKMEYPHPMVNHTNGKQNSFPTINYALN